jgi:signal transduction histidine kinase
MVTLGEMTAGLAHEIKNPLNFVTNFSAVAQDMLVELEQAPDDAARAVVVSDLKSNLGRIMDHGRRADSIIQGMMQHARGGSGDWERTDMNALVEDAVQLAYNGARATHISFDVTIVRDYHPSPLPTKVVPQEISRVLLNILNNAMYATRTAAVAPAASSDRHAASPDAETVTADALDPTIWISTSRHSGSVEIRIRDNGPGVPEMIQQKIFQPFFTTKPTGEGTGLGLSMSYDIIVNGHGGSLFCNSDDGGAEFIITLPESSG